ncbi:MAG TPA: hypothetical protein VFV34_20565 [Blastocatellia bacterium]|nr:hypothetical protein [Blastocatellia bacterium]
MPVVRYDVGDGLAASKIQAVYQSAKGYLWFATRDGLSRFDGYEFVSYGPGDGVPFIFINAIAEGPQARAG